MDKSVKLKIALLGPSKTGKTVIANFLSDVTETVPGDEVRKTKGVRIVEFQVDGSGLTKSQAPKIIDVELWDCSGDKRYELYRPVFLHEANGAIIVCSSSEISDQKKDVEALISLTSEKLPQSKLLLFVNHYDNDDDDDKEKESKLLKSILSKIQHVNIDVESKGDELRNEFSKFVYKIIEDD